MSHSRLRAFCCISCLSLLPAFAQAAGQTTPAQTANIAEAEVQRCEDKIASVQRDVLGRYDDALLDMLTTSQKAADLEAALAVRSERERLKTEHSLTDGDLVIEPKSLRALQSQYLAKQNELVGSLVRDTLPRLIEYKKSLTIAGKLDEAVAVRTAIDNLESNHLPAVKPDASAVQPAESILLAYSGDRARADKNYKGQKITVHGIVGGYRQDPADARSYLIYLTGPQTGGGWIQCAFNSPEYRFREEPGSFGSTTLLAIPRGAENGIRIQKGQLLDVHGTCQGFDEVLRMVKCDLPK